MRAYHCAQWTVLIIFPPNLQTVTIAQMLSKSYSILWEGRIGGSSEIAGLDIDGPENDGPIVTKLQRVCRFVKESTVNR